MSLRLAYIKSKAYILLEHKLMSLKPHNYHNKMQFVFILLFTLLGGHPTSN